MRIARTVPPTRWELRNQAELTEFFSSLGTFELDKHMRTIVAGMAGEAVLGGGY